MKMRLLLILFLAIGTQARAQRNMPDDYRHTIHYLDQKTVFQLQGIGDERKFTDPTKKYHWFASNQIKVTQGGYSGRLLHGDYEDYYASKNLKEKGTFKMGLKSGEWKAWDENGVLRSKVNFIEGTLSGRFYHYDTVGRLKEEGKYKDGQLHGKLMRTISKDSVQVINYKNGAIKPAPVKRKWLKKLLFWKKNNKKS